MKISVFGLGYVGAVTAGCLSRRGHEIIGVDVQPKKVEAFNRGEPPIIEPGLEELFRHAKAKGLLRATVNSEEAIQQSEVSIICVGTPTSESGALDLTYVREVVGQIAKILKRTSKKHAMLFRSTMMPGATAQIANEFLLDLEENGQVEIICYPEFLREGTAVDDFENPSLVVVGTREGQPPSAHLLPLIGEKASVLPLKAAEMVKHTSNAFHATKVTFANELGRLMKAMEIDAQAVMALLCQDTKLNLSAYYMKPGNPFGGSCLPKDVRALCHEGRDHGLSLPLLENLLPSNRIHFQTLLDLILRLESADVTILGLSFKQNTDDLRESAMVEIAQELWRKNYNLKIFDTALNLAGLIGTNKREIDIKMPHLASLLKTDLSAAIGPKGLIVAAQKCVSFSEIAKVVTPQHIILDVNGWRELRQLPSRYEGFCW
ncbi:MAG TPA: nucleotide sugar dehydrogenase [Verrucomicrobiae bacterium]|jgi:GDP-mannose 6-dehydrogenase